MTRTITTFRNGQVFDGHQLHKGVAVQFVQGRLARIGPERDIGAHGDVIDLAGDILSPGYVDLQVNGGGGVMLNDDPCPDVLRRIARAHRGLGVAAFLPTLITDTPDKTRAAIGAVQEAIRLGVPGIAGLHLEGPHLSVARKGAHDAALIRAMTNEDLNLLLAAARSLPLLKVTVAPENVSEAQVSQLASAGALVSLGHTDADFATCQRYAGAGATCVTHLFNAMSQMGNREPGVAGATLENGALSAGLIADGVHVHPATMRAAWRAKAGPGRIYLVSDAMAVAGSDETEFRLGERVIQRKDGRLTLRDGTLAGADLDLTTAVRVLVEQAGARTADALAAATRVPASLIGRWNGLAQGRGYPIDEMIVISAGLDQVTPADALTAA